MLGFLLDEMGLGTYTGVLKMMKTRIESLTSSVDRYMCMCVYVYMCVYMCVCMCVYMCVHVCTCMYVYMFVCVQVYSMCVKCLGGLGGWTEE